MYLDEIERIAKNSGSHWFDRDTMSFFKTRLLYPTFAHRDRRKRWTFFVTSERAPAGPRLYTVRLAKVTGPKMDGHTRRGYKRRKVDISSPLGFQTFGNARAAKEAARKLANAGNR